MSRRRVAILISGRGSNMAALIAGVKISGATVHFVIPETDAGPIIMQGAVPVAADDTVAALEARVLTVEHQIYPLALALLAQGGVKLVEGRCIIDATIASDDR